jgi:hypothetical protein
MLSVDFDRKARVLRVTVTGMYVPEDMEELDRRLIEFVAHHGQPRGIFDYSGVEVLAIPLSRLIQRAQQPAIILERVVVASRIIKGEGARAFARYRREAGVKESPIVDSLYEAYTLFGLKNPRFEPVDR